MQQNSSFNSIPAGRYRRVFTSAFWFVALTWGLLGIPLLFLPEAIKQNPEAKNLWSITVFVVDVGLALTLVFHFIPMIREFWQSHFFVELTETSVIGRNLWKQSTELRFEEIVRIQPEPHVKRFRGIPWGLDFTTADGRRIRLHPNVERFGECVEEIRSRCKNLVEVDYGGLDKNPKIWTEENKMW